MSRWIVWLLVAIVLCLPVPALAHGTGKPQLNNVDAGPFRLTVWTSPDPMRVGEVHVAVIVKPQAGTGNGAVESAADLRVEVTVIPANGTAPPLVQNAARQETFLQTYYESYFDLSTVGEWQTRIVVSSAAGVGEVEFPMQVFARQQIPWELALGLLILLVSLIGAVRVIRVKRAD